MYYHNDQLAAMLNVYSTIDCVGEILIINNSPKDSISFNVSKVKEIGIGENMFVNPSWKYGAALAENELLIIANDDITIHGDLNGLLERVKNILPNSNRVIGPGRGCFDLYQKENTNTIKLKPSVSRDKYTINYGFGVFMFVTKHIFMSTSMPKDFLIWYGDHLLYLYNSAWEFTGLNIVTSMRGTTSKMNLKKQAELERRAFFNIKMGK